MNENMTLYNAVRTVPPEAQKPIESGRLKGKTDINPMWRIRVLTEHFGPCGKGWYTDGVSYWTVPCAETKELAVFCQLYLHVKHGDEWIEPIYGIGGNKVIACEKNGMHLDDEAYKKSYTDAVSVACKALGVGADVYWQEDRSKYGKIDDDDDKAAGKDGMQAKPEHGHEEKPAQESANHSASSASYRKSRNLSLERFVSLRKACIDGGIVQEKPSADMTQKDWQTLFDAIDAIIGYMPA